MDSFIDLHIHSTFSDGQYTPSQIVDEVIKNNVHCFSITDHDDIRSVSSIKQMKLDDLYYIPGVELSATVDIANRRQWIHILGYAFDENCSELLEELDSKRKIRRKGNQLFLKKLLLEFSFLSSDMYEKIDCDRFIRFSRLVMEYLEKESYSSDQILFIQKYLAKVKPEYPNYEFSDIDALSLISRAGGYSVLAHPYQYHLSDIEEMKLLERLKEHGLFGLELYHSGDSYEGMFLQEKFANILKIYGTVGSDFHTDYDDFGNQIGYGKNHNLCKRECSFVKTLKMREGIR